MGNRGIGQPGHVRSGKGAIGNILAIGHRRRAVGGPSVRTGRRETRRRPLRDAPGSPSQCASSRSPRNRFLHPRAFRSTATVARFLLGPASHAYGIALETPRYFRRDFILSPIGPLEVGPPRWRAVRGTARANVRGVWSKSQMCLAFSLATIPVATGPTVTRNCTLSAAQLLG